MNLALFANILTMILCLTVTIQSVRMMRSLKGVHHGQMGAAVVALDGATAQARAVLSELKRTLSGEGAANGKLVAEGRAMRDELRMMIEIADGMAERLMESSRPEAVRVEPVEESVLPPCDELPLREAA